MNCNYNKTMYACFVGYIVQAIVNNFVPLLFLTFHNSYGIALTQITFLVTINFGVQLLVDAASVGFVDKIGYRAAMLLAHAVAAAGLIALTILPELLPNAYVGLLIATVLYAVGGGLLEVVVSPVMEACPTENKETAMSLLHSFYCWGHVGVVLISTLFFHIAGISNWRVMAVVWALVPIANMIAFMKVPVPELLAEGEKGMSLGQLFTSKVFWLFVLLMACAGSCEQAVSQWASTFAEQGLQVSKTIGDLAGPMFFAIAMGSARAVYGKFGEKLPLEKCMVGSGILCLFSYLLIALAPVPALSLVGCGICGFSVGILWPGTFSLASKSMPTGGTALFAMLALGGDVGCSGGPTFVGIFSGLLDDNLARGILCAVVFPVLLLVGLAIHHKIAKNVNGTCGYNIELK
ncbi:MAG: MFS transporter [Lachnospiraceae bacterium]|nr:MFS transporter [Lachnospiraceae bacterium]MDE7202650.1 MFS transporter [Lachnospiraceae bacterium]